VTSPDPIFELTFSADAEVTRAGQDTDDSVER